MFNAGDETLVAVHEKCVNILYVFEFSGVSNYDRLSVPNKPCVESRI